MLIWYVSGKNFPKNAQVLSGTSILYWHNSDTCDLKVTLKIRRKFSLLESLYGANHTLSSTFRLSSENVNKPHSMQVHCACMNCVVRERTSNKVYKRRRRIPLQLFQKILFWFLMIILSVLVVCFLIQMHPHFMTMSMKILPCGSGVCL